MERRCSNLSSTTSIEDSLTWRMEGSLYQAVNFVCVRLDGVLGHRKHLHRPSGMLLYTIRCGELGQSQRSNESTTYAQSSIKLQKASPWQFPFTFPHLSLQRQFHYNRTCSSQPTSLVVPSLSPSLLSAFFPFWVSFFAI